MSKIRKANFLVPTPKQYVGKVLSSLGRQGGAIGRFGVSTPWLAHAIVDWAMHNLLSKRWLVDYTYGEFLENERREHCGLADLVIFHSFPPPFYFSFLLFSLPGSCS